MMLRTRIISDFSELAALAPEWHDLWRRCHRSTPFQSPDWLLAWWPAFAPGELTTVAAYDGSRLVGLAPLYLEQSASGGRLLPLGISLSDYLDILVEPGFEISVLRALLETLARDSRWSAIELDDLAPDATALQIEGCGHWVVSDHVSHPCPVLGLSPSQSGIPESVPASKRRKLRMAQHRAARRGKVEFIEADASSAYFLFEWLVRLHAARWETRAMPGVLADPRVQSFHRAVLARLSPERIVRLYALRIGGEVAAVYYGFQDRDRVYAYLGGFDPAFAFESPGTLLLGHIIEACCREGVREFHFLRGAESYKYGWGARDRFNRRLEVQRAAANVDA